MQSFHHQMELQSHDFNMTRRLQGGSLHDNVAPCVCFPLMLDIFNNVSQQQMRTKI